MGWGGLGLGLNLGLGLVPDRNRTRPNQDWSRSNSDRTVPLNVRRYEVASDSGVQLDGAQQGCTQA